MDSADKYKSTIGFIDILFNILIGFVFLFLIAFLLINPIAKKNDIISPAEFLIILTWPPDFNDDIDIWMRGPEGEYVGFRSKEIGIFHLERDDLGYVNDLIVYGDNEIAVRKNQETIAIRGIYPGEYLISAMYYSSFDSEKTGKTIPLILDVIKVNPYSIIYTQNKSVSQIGQQVNFYSFRIDSTGKIESIRETDLSAVPFERHW